MHDPHQEFFDQLAAEWDYTFTAEDLERLSHLVDNLGVDKGMDILDIGCGTGILFDILRRKVGAEGSITGVDFSFEMAEKAHRNFPFQNVNVVDADVLMLPFEDSTFDMALAFASFPHFSDKQKAVDEVHRVLKAGSKFHIIHLESSKEVVDTHKRVGGAVTDDELPDEAQLRDMFEKSKFQDLSVKDHPGLFLASAANSK